MNCQTCNNELTKNNSYCKNCKTASRLGWVYEAQQST